MTQVRRDFGQRDQDEFSQVETGVREEQSGAFFHEIVKKKNIEVDRPRTLVGALRRSLSSEQRLNRETRRQQLLRALAGRDLGRGVEQRA